MLDIVNTALDLQGLWLLCIAAFLSGLVRGFSGFGGALVFLPIAAHVLPPSGALIVLTLIELLGPVPVLIATLKYTHKGDLFRLSVAMILTLPLGLLLLFALHPSYFQFMVSILSLVMVGVLASGWRYKNKVSKIALWGIGAASGILGGTAGLPGPPVIVFYMSSKHKVEAIRANISTYLFIFDLVLLAMFAVSAKLSMTLVVLSAVAFLPNLIGNLIGAAIFKPQFEQFYRIAAYVFIAASALFGLYELTS